jgi:tRNA(Ile)-lysidine synthase
MRADIEAALRALGITWRDDASNVSDDYFRNRIRHRVLPVLKEASPTRLLPNVLHTRSLLQEDDAALEAWVDMLFEKTAFSHPLAVSVLQGKPRALCRRVLYRWLHAHQLSLTRMLFERILCAIDGQKTGLWSVRADALVVLQNGCLSLEVATQPERTWPVRGFLIPGGSVFFPNGFVLHAEQIPLTAALISSVMQGRVDPQKEAYLIPPLALPLSVRPHRSGDRFHPLGAAGSKKLKDCFTDKKIPLTARARLPVVFSAEGEVLWCPGFPPSEKSRLEHGNLYALRLTYSSSDCLLNSFSL